VFSCVADTLANFDGVIDPILLTLKAEKFVPKAASWAVVKAVTAAPVRLFSCVVVKDAICAVVKNDASAATMTLAELPINERFAIGYELMLVTCGAP